MYNRPRTHLKLRRNLSTAHIGISNFSALVALAGGNRNVCAALDWRPPLPGEAARASAPVATTSGPVREKLRARRPAKIADIEVDTLIDQFERGQTLSELAIEFGAHRTTISSLLRKAGIGTNRHLLSPAIADTIRRLYTESGLSCAMIGKQLDKTPAAIHGILTRNGVELRPVHRHFPVGAAARS